MSVACSRIRSRLGEVDNSHRATVRWPCGRAWPAPRTVQVACLSVALMGYRRCRKRGGTCGATLLGYGSSPETTSEVIRAAAGHMESDPNVASSVSWEVVALVAEEHSN